MCDTSTTPQYQLALIVREETDDGRDNVRFLKHVAYGELDFDGFKPRHRIAAAKELLLRGFGPVSDWPEHIVEIQTGAHTRPAPEIERSRSRLL